MFRRSWRRLGIPCGGTLHRTIRMSPTERITALHAALGERILVLDGAMGTAIHALNPTADDWGGARFENCSEMLVLTHPEWIQQIHQGYLDAGADIVETDTFGG